MNNYTNRLTQQTSVEEGMKQARARTEVEAQGSSDTHPKQIEETANTQTFDYFLFKVDGEYVAATDDGGTIDEASGWYYDDEAEPEGVVLDKNHYFIGYFFYNDEDDYDDVDEYMEERFNEEQHIHLYHDAFNAGGHLQLVKIEEWMDGKIVNTVTISTRDG